jgi:hypothetical protein
MGKPPAEVSSCTGRTPKANHRGCILSTIRRWFTGYIVEIDRNGDDFRVGGKGLQYLRKRALTGQVANKVDHDLVDHHDSRSGGFLQNLHQSVAHSFPDRLEGFSAGRTRGQGGIDPPPVAFVLLLSQPLAPKAVPVSLVELSKLRNRSTTPTGQVATNLFGGLPGPAERAVEKVNGLIRKLWGKAFKLTTTIVVEADIDPTLNSSVTVPIRFTVANQQ